MRRIHFGFTETMIAIGVIGVVGTFTYPLLRGGGKIAGRTLCLQNMKQIGNAILLYTEDSDGTYPRTTYERPNAGLGYHWAVLVQPYINDERAFVCSGENSVPAEYHRFNRRFLLPELSYINNYAVIPAHDFFPVRASQIDRGQNMILVAERREKIASLGTLKSWKGTTGFTPGQPCRGLRVGVDYQTDTPEFVERKRLTAKDDKDLLLIRVDWTVHDNASNYLFLDGHVEREQLSATLRLDAYQWGDRFYPVSMPNARCDRPFPRKENP